jgi:hypothetical protein
VASRKSASVSTVRDPAQCERELEALEELLGQLFPADSTAWAALVNALVMEGETRRPREAVVNRLVQALASLRGPNSVAEGLLFQLVRPLLKTLALPLQGKPALEEGQRTYSFGERMTHQVSHLRNVLGLSKLYVYRHLRYDMGVRMPSYALMQCISSVWSLDEVLAAAARLRT